MNVQWEDENLGESICNALKKEEVTYADIEGITGISIDSQYVVKLDWKDKTEQYVYNSGKYLFIPVNSCHNYTQQNQIVKKV